MTSLLIVLVLATSPAIKTPSGEAAVLKRHIDQFAPVALTADVNNLPDGERRALAKILQAAKLMDTLFLRQVWPGNEPLLYDLSQDMTPVGRLRLHAFLLNKGPWDRIDTGSIIPATPAKPDQGSFYPGDATKAEVEQWLKSLKEDARKQALGFYTVVRRGPDGKLLYVPFSEEYQGELIRAATLLREAATLTGEPTLRDFLNKRAASFISNDYRDSDLAWMGIQGAIEPTLGPYEVYEDRWFNAKSAFESFISLRDDGASKGLARLTSELQDIENHLPVDPSLRNPKLGGQASIVVVNTLFSSGDGNRGVMTAAYNLPNDEAITHEKGTKRVMLKNIQEAKFQKTLLPIARIALPPSALKDVSFDVFFTHILMHELMHGLGPHEITLNGRHTTPREELQDAHSAIEEAKADISGLFALQYLVDKGSLDKTFERTMYTTYLASMFRSIRFGLDEAHGRAVAMELNYLMDHGGVRVGADGRFSVDPAKVKAAVNDLTHDLLMVEARGDRDGAKKLLEKLGNNRPETVKVLNQLSAVPVDIEPRYTTAEKLIAQGG